MHQFPPSGPPLMVRTSPSEEIAHFGIVLRPLDRCPFQTRNPTNIHHLPHDPEFLVEFPNNVQILRIYQSHGRIG